MDVPFAPKLTFFLPFPGEPLEVLPSTLEEDEMVEREVGLDGISKVFLKSTGPYENLPYQNCRNETRGRWDISIAEPYLDIPVSVE